MDEIDRMRQLADSLEREDRRALVIQIWDHEIRGANELVVKALRAYLAAQSHLFSQKITSTPGERP